MIKEIVIATLPANERAFETKQKNLVSIIIHKLNEHKKSGCLFFDVSGYHINELGEPILDGLGNRTECTKCRVTVNPRQLRKVQNYTLTNIITEQILKTIDRMDRNIQQQIIIAGLMS